MAWNLGDVLGGGIIGDEWASLDWSSGIIFAGHGGLGDIEELLSKPLTKGTQASDQTDRLQALTHEYLHVMQMVTTGYCYSLCCELSQVIVQESKGWKTFEDAASGALMISPKVQPLFDRIDAPGPNNVTTRSLIECSAFLSEHRIHWQGVTDRIFIEEILDDAPGLEYRYAFDAATAVLGYEAFDVFPLLANMSLCTKRPAEIFDSLLHTLRRRGSRLGLSHNRDVVLDTLNGQFGQELLGTSAELASEGMYHPIYTPLVAKLNDLGVNVMEYFCAPHRLSDEIVRAIETPVVYRRKSDDAPAAWLPPAMNAAKGVESESLRNLFVLAAVSRLALNTSDPPPIEPLPMAARAPDPIMVRPAVMNFPADAVNQCDPSALVGLLAEVAADGEHARGARATLVLEYEDIDHLGSAYLLDPKIAAFVRGLYEQIPHLFYYLQEPPILNHLNEYLAAYASPSDLVETAAGKGVSPGPELIGRLLLQLIETAIFCTSVDDDAERCIGRVLAALGPAEDSEDLLTAVLEAAGGSG